MHLFIHWWLDLITKALLWGMHWNISIEEKPVIRLYWCHTSPLFWLPLSWRSCAVIPPGYGSFTSHDENAFEDEITHHDYKLESPKPSLFPHLKGYNSWILTDANYLPDANYLILVAKEHRMHL